MGQKSQLWWDIPAQDSLELLTKILRSRGDSFYKRLQEMSSMLGVENLLNVQIRKLSLGERE